MSVITIQCRLVADEATLSYLWELMAQKNTPLINELLEQVGLHSDFQTWQQKGFLPYGLVKQLCEPLKIDPRFIGQPGRFYTSAIATVNYIYKSWFALQRRRQRQKEGKERWLSMLKSDVELEKESGCSLSGIRARAIEIMQTATAQSDQSNNLQTQSKKSKKPKKGKADLANDTLFNSLFKAYENTQDTLSRCALVYLLKNKLQVSYQEESPNEYAQKRRQKEIEIERLDKQLKSQMPSGRDLTNEKWRSALEFGTRNVLNDDEFKIWQASLLRESSCVPFPVTYETNTDLTWFTNDLGRLEVRFNGSRGHTFEVYCDRPKAAPYGHRRQQHLFKRFQEDWQIHHNNKDQYSAGLFTLRSGRLVWQEREGKGEPWNVHRLTLHCSVDTRLWTAQGTESIRCEKIALADKTLSNMKEKGDLSPNQQDSVKRKQSELNRLNNSFPRPSIPLYQGQSHILVGVSLGLDKPVTVAVVDATKGLVLAYRSVKQLLGDNYRLLNRRRQQQQRNSHQRHLAQKQNAPNQLGSANLGQYVDRLLAASIIAIAKTYLACSIVLPKLGNIQSQVQSEIQARAEAKCPGYKEGQKKYAKQYRVSVHNWSYGRLTQNIQIAAVKAGIAIEVELQSPQGSSQEKARDLALAAYHSRTATTI